MAAGIFGKSIFKTIKEFAAERRDAIYVQIEESSTPGLSFYVMVIISTTIASYGLLANSIAVVIGAMLLAPLMGPILGVSLSLTTGNNGLLYKAIRSELAGVLLAVAVGYAIGVMPLRADFGQEILSRTQPTLYDIIVALASGTAGAYALIDKRVSPALAGVAISTSLAPPLAACGLCISAYRWDAAGGAFLLFLANFLAIELASAFIFVLFGINTTADRGKININYVLKHFSISIIALIVVASLVTNTLVQIINDKRLYQEAQTVLSQNLRSILGAQLSDLDIRERDGSIDVVAVVLSPQEIEPEVIMKIENRLRNRLDRRVRLVIRSLISKDADSKGMVFIPDIERERGDEVDTQTQLITESALILKNQLRSVPGASLVDIRVEKENDGDINISIVTAVIRTPEAIIPEKVSEIEGIMTHELMNPVHLVVRSIITRDADASGYIYDTGTKSKSISEREARFRKRMKSALINQLKNEIPGAVLKEYKYSMNGNQLYIMAITMTPQTFEPDQVSRIQESIREHVYPRTVLVVRSIVGADTSSYGFISNPTRQ